MRRDTLVGEILLLLQVSCSLLILSDGFLWKCYTRGSIVSHPPNKGGKGEHIFSPTQDMIKQCHRQMMIFSDDREGGGGKGREGKERGK